MFDFLFIKISVKDILLIWYLLYSLVVIFCKPVRNSLIQWLQSLNKDKNKYYSLKSEFKIDKEYDNDLQKELQNKVISEIKKEKE